VDTVFLQRTHSAAAPDPSEGVAPQWTALSALTGETTSWSHVTVDIASRLAPRNSNLLRVIIRSLIGNMQFSAITLHQTGSAESEILEYPIKIWGLTLGMTLDLMARMDCSPFSAANRSSDIIPYKTAPNIASVVPRFSYPDVNFWIWVFGKRYREVIRRWESSQKDGGSNDRRINWLGTALHAFYASVRKALVVVLVLRALGIAALLLYVGLWLLT